MVYKPAIKNNYAFTLVELLIAVSVMLVLTAVTVMLLNPTKLRSDANETKALSELGTVTNAMEFYYSDKKFYPSTLAALSTDSYINDAGLLTDDAGVNYCYLTKGTPVNSYKICTKSTKVSARTALLELQNLTVTPTTDDYTRTTCTTGNYPNTQKVQCLQSPF